MKGFSAEVGHSQECMILSYYICISPNNLSDVNEMNLFFFFFFVQNQTGFLS